MILAAAMASAFDHEHVWASTARLRGRACALALPSPAGGAAPRLHLLISAVPGPRSRPAGCTNLRRACGVEDRRHHHQLVGLACASTKRSRPRRTVSGEPTTEHASMPSACCLLRRRPVGVDVVDRRLLQASRAAVQVGERLLERGEQPLCLGVGLGGDHVHADHCVRPLQLLGGLELRAGTARSASSGRRARSATRTRTAGPARAASCAPKRLDPRIHSGTSSPAPGTACMAGPLRGPEQRLQLLHVLREVFGGARIAPQRPHGRWSVPGRAAEAESMRPG